MKSEDKLFAATIAAYSPKAQKRLKELRALVHQTAREAVGVGEISEALRWYQFSFLTLQTGAGSTIRIDAKRNDQNKVAMYFHCQSGLIEHFKELYASTLKFEGQRAIVFDVQDPLPKTELAHCISLALTHHVRKIRRPRSA